ncbi:hypothetical protein D9M68_252420 [compost metagenome]|uniref:Uncharacterized membrane protein n=1 Tax=Pseudomonas jinjuensis TaxID=198616 RepID=A0A1G9YJM4_9PSED|nr:DUF2061 domain-containing protein [Pseudomonas jinjuensis]SDN08716.1 Uncharacterized membrane protein [Pseudomonas jinjuensis]
MLKTLTFTVMHFVIAFSVAYALTGSVTVGGLVAVIEPLCNSVGFYFHEKLWKRIEGRRGEEHESHGHHCLPFHA